MGKSKNQKYGPKVAKPQPLTDQILHENEAAPYARGKERSKIDVEGGKYIDGTLGQSIIKQSLAQLQELDDEEFPPLGTVIKRKRPKESVNVSLVRTGVKKTFKKRETRKNDPEEESDTETIDENVDATPLNVEKIVKDFEDKLDLDKEDLDILEHFRRKDATPQRRLADLFRDKITEKQTEIQSELDTESVCGVALNPNLIASCKSIGEILHKYRSGPLPKMFKSFPSMSCWEQLIHETEPDQWTAAAVYQATRIFVSNLKASMAQRYCNLVLLPRIRDDISFYKRLNFHLYQALTKSLYKSSAFFKGIILPLCSEGDCTLREAIIIGSVIADNHIPLANSAAAILSIISMDYQGANSIFLRVLFDKKYALPYQVIDECVEHFQRFAAVRESLPVLWHQSLLSFVQRYKNDMTAEQKEDLLELVSVQGHYKVTPQIRRELQMSTNREAMNID